jgi:hypothetical protein
MYSMTHSFNNLDLLLYKSSVLVAIRDKKNNKLMPGMMVHAYNLIYSGGRSRKIVSVSPTKAKLA